MQAKTRSKPPGPPRLDADPRGHRAAGREADRDTIHPGATQPGTPRVDATSPPPQARPGSPNGWRQGRVLRTLWPAGAGTRRWLKQHGAALVCVRHREDPAGLRRVVTVELLVDEVRSRRRARRLHSQAIYPLRVAPGARELWRLLKAHGAWQDGDRGLWYARGHVIETLNLLDWIVLPQPRQGRRLRPASRRGHGHAWRRKHQNRRQQRFPGWN